MSDYWKYRESHLKAQKKYDDKNREKRREKIREYERERARKTREKAKKYDLYKEVIEEVIRYIDVHKTWVKNDDEMVEPILDGYNIRDLLQILDKAKDVK